MIPPRRVSAAAPRINSLLPILEHHITSTFILPQQHALIQPLLQLTLQNAQKQQAEILHNAYKEIKDAEEEWTAEREKLIKQKQSLQGDELQWKEKVELRNRIKQIQAKRYIVPFASLSSKISVVPGWI